MPGAANPSQHGLLVVNHEYTNEELMFPGIGLQEAKDVNFAKHDPRTGRHRDGRPWRQRDRDQRDGGKWRWSPIQNTPAASTADTPMEITGPAAGHTRLQTKADPTGARVLGMVNNCAGGVTPWGTWLTCEENFHGYFWGKLAAGHPEAANYKRYGVPGNPMPGANSTSASTSPRSPTSPTASAGSSRSIRSIPPRRRRSAQRSAASSTKAPRASSTRTAATSSIIGDDERFDYVYHFVTEARVDLANRAANRDMLDDGALSVAKYNADGTGEWLPLVHGQGPLTEANGFASQADVLIETRRAADLLGATKMDRPEDVEANPQDQQGLCDADQQHRRKADQADAANPRADNEFGHIIEMTPPAATTPPPTFTLGNPA